MAAGLSISLVVSTYDRPDALAAVLRAVGRQTLAPRQVIVGDDGSGPETARVIEAAAKTLPNLLHVRQEHDGFRVARARNAAIARATGDYLVLIDGDILIHRNFLEDHARAAEPNRFVQGSRACLDERLTRVAIEREDYWPSFFAPGLGNRKNVIRCAALSRLFRGMGDLVRASNFGLWREDAIRVNGFNEDFVGWGSEDREFALRLANAGCAGKHLLFLALCCHLHHPPSSRDRRAINRAIRQSTVDTHAAWCPHGLDSHMRGA